MIYIIILRFAHKKGTLAIVFMELQMLTRRDFREIADICQEFDCPPLMLRELADFCASSNSRFDRGRFYRRAGLRDSLIARDDYSSISRDYLRD